MRHIPALFFVASLAACGTLPDIAEPDKLFAADAGYPDFVPIDQITAGQAEADAAALETEDTLAARVSGLRARAARLRATATE